MSCLPYSQQAQHPHLHPVSADAFSFRRMPCAGSNKNAGLDAAGVDVLAADPSALSTCGHSRVNFGLHQHAAGATVERRRRRCPAAGANCAAAPLNPVSREPHCVQVCCSFCCRGCCHPMAAAAAAAARSWCWWLCTGTLSAWRLPAMSAPLCILLQALPPSLGSAGSGDASYF